MSKFCRKSSIVTENISGHAAYRMNSKERLATAVLTCLFNENKFYGDNSEDIVNTIKEVIETDAEFVANLCLYARKEMHLRSISHVILAEMAKSQKCKVYVRKTIEEGVLRADDMTEMLAYYIQNYGKPIPNSMKKGIADKLITFNEYQLAKYKGNGAVKLKDMLCLVHPKARDEVQSDMFKRLLEDRLETPVTWETQLSARGNSKEVWEELIAEKKLGYMAMLRNLRNIIRAEVTNLDKVYDYLSDKKNVENNRLLPFRYYSAYRAVSAEGIGTSKTFDTLETAIRHSAEKISRLQGKTMIAADVSGSMNCQISSNSEVTCAEIAVLMMALANYICEDAITATFDTSLYVKSLSSMNGIIANANSIRVNGGGTDISLPLRYLLKNKIFVDRIILLSDNEINYGYGQVCQRYVEEYKKRVNPKVWVHAIDMQGYGTQQFQGERVNIIGGWSEKVLEFMGQVEQGSQNLVERIENYYFGDKVVS